MCGILGYVGPKDVLPIILDGLHRLEYRGYDSAGVAIGGRSLDTLKIFRAPGKLFNLELRLAAHEIKGSYGIGHTRWATHGRPSEDNAHPHRDCTGQIVVVHNGIVENHLALRSELSAQGHKLVTETDTEIIPHLIEQIIRSSAQFGELLSLEEAVRRAVRRLAGTFALGVVSAAERDKIVVARCGPPVVIGIGDGETFVASDIPGILQHTRQVYFLGDGEMAVLTPSGVALTDFQGRAVSRATTQIHWDPAQAEKGGYPHFMLKEIWEQPHAVRDTATGRVGSQPGQVHLEELHLTDEELASASRVYSAACGTSWHAALVGKHMMETLAHLPLEVDYASEYRYRHPIIDPTALGLLISQSGETADTIAAQREMSASGIKTIAICNVVGSMVTREADGAIFTHAGPEIGVASTKAFVAQLVALYLLALKIAQVRGTLDSSDSRRLLEQLLEIPRKIEQILPAASDQCRRLAAIFQNASGFLFLGRGVHFPVALEGALKLKEISYVHAEGYPAGEMKHGPNALIDEKLPVFVLATHDREDPNSVIRYQKTLGNIQEVTARSGRVIAIATKGDTTVEKLAEQVIYLPPAPEVLSPILEIVPLQLFAYAMAVLRGCDVDQPRNLAKSVTVE